MPIKKQKPEDIMESEDFKKEVLGKTDKKTCINCNETAIYCMRGLPENSYCKKCAQDYFKLLSYLEKIK